MTRADYALARYIARDAVRDQIRARGEKVAHYSARQIVELADDWIEEHQAEITRELVMRRWERWLSPERSYRNRG
jgi:hypothetical protein